MPCFVVWWCVNIFSAWWQEFWNSLANTVSFSFEGLRETVFGIQWYSTVIVHRCVKRILFFRDFAVLCWKSSRLSLQNVTDIWNPCVYSRFGEQIKILNKLMESEPSSLSGLRSGSFIWYSDLIQIEWCLCSQRPGNVDQCINLLMS